MWILLTRGFGEGFPLRRFLRALTIGLCRDKKPNKGSFGYGVPRARPAVANIASAGSPETRGSLLLSGWSKSA